MSIDELSAGEGRKLFVRSDDPAGAKKILEAKFGVEGAVVTGREVHFRTGAELSEITRELVMSGLNIYGVAEEEVSLEDVFMSKVHSRTESVPGDREAEDVR